MELPIEGLPVASPRERSGRQLGLLWGVVALALLIASPLAETLAGSGIVCPIKSLTDVPCGACGTTRSALALAGFDPVAAFSWNPLATLGWMFLIGGGLLAGIAALAGYAIPEPGRLSLRVRVTAILLFLANWAYLIASGV